MPPIKLLTQKLARPAARQRLPTTGKLAPKAKSALLITMKEISAAAFPTPPLTPPNSPGFLAPADAGLIHINDAHRIGRQLRSPVMRKRDRGAPRTASPGSIKTDLSAFQKVLASILVSSSTNIEILLVLDHLKAGSKIEGSVAESVARFVLGAASLQNIPDREIRRHFKILDLLLGGNLPPCGDLLPKSHTARAVNHRLPLAVCSGNPIIEADALPREFNISDQRGLSKQTLSDFVTALSFCDAIVRWQSPDERFLHLLQTQMAAFSSVCKDILSHWLDSADSNTTMEVLYSILTLILLEGTNYSVVVTSRLFWNEKKASYELRARKPRAGHGIIRLTIRDPILANSLIRIRQTRKKVAANQGLLLVSDGRGWEEIRPADYIKWLNPLLPPGLFTTRVVPSQFRTTLAQSIGLQNGRGIYAVKDTLDHKSLQQSAEYVDSPFFRWKQDKEAVIILRKVDTLALSHLDRGTLLKLGLDCKTVENDVKALADFLSLPHPKDAGQPLLAFDAVNPSPACDRRKAAADEMPLASCGLTSAVLAVASHFIAHNLSRIVEYAQDSLCNKQSEVTVSFYLLGNAQILHNRLLKVHEAVSLLSTSIEIVFRFNGIKPPDQPAVLQTNPFYEAVSWRITLGQDPYVKPISRIAAFVIEELAKSRSQIGHHLSSTPFVLLQVSTRTIGKLLYLYGMPQHWELQSGHSAPRPLFTPARLTDGLAFLWAIASAGRLSAFAYQSGDHAFSNGTRLQHKIDRAWIADPVGPYSRRIVPRLAQIIAAASVQQAPSKNLIQVTSVDGARKRLPGLTYGVNRAPQLELRIALLRRIVDGSFVSVRLRCTTIQEVLGWDIATENIEPIKSKNLTRNHLLHGNLIVSIKSLLSEIKALSASGATGRAATTNSAIPFLSAPSPDATVQNSASNPSSRSDDLAIFEMHCETDVGPDLLIRLVPQQTMENSGAIELDSSHVVAIKEPASSKSLAGSIEGSAAKSPPGSVAQLSSTWQAFIDMAESDSQRAISTIKDEQSALKNFSLFLCRHGKTLMRADVDAGLKPTTPDDVDMWKADLIEHGLEPSTVNKYLARMGRAIASRIKLQICNPVATIEGIVAQASKAVDRTIRIPRGPEPTEQQFYAIWEELGRDRNGQRNQMILELAFATGARVSELASVQIGPLQSYSGAISISFEQKGGSYRTVSISQDLGMSLRALQSDPKYLSDPRTKGKAESSGYGPIFRSEGGGRLSADQMSRIVSSAADRAGYPKITIHRMRAVNFSVIHYITNASSGGNNDANAAHMAGHSSFETTARHYVDVKTSFWPEEGGIKPFDWYSPAAARARSID